MGYSSVVVTSLINDKLYLLDVISKIQKPEQKASRDRLSKIVDTLNLVINNEKEMQTLLGDVNRELRECKDQLSEYNIFSGRMMIKLDQYKERITQLESKLKDKQLYEQHKEVL